MSVDMMDYFYNRFVAQPEVIMMSVPAAAIFGIDVSLAPVGSICVLKSGNVEFVIFEDEDESDDC